MFPALTAAGLTGVLLLCAGLSSRVGQQRRTGAALAGAGVVFGTTAGFIAAGGERELTAFEAPHVLLACVALLLAAVAGQIVVACYTPAFVGAGTLGVLGSLIVGGGLVAGVSAATTTGIALVVLLVLSTLLPGVSLRLARLPFPHVPADPAEFRQGETPTLDSDVLAETRKADEFLTGLLWATSLAAAACALTLAFTADTWAWSLAATTGLVLLLRSRHLRHTGQRVAVMAGGFAALGVIVVPLLHLLDPLAQLGVAAAIVGVGAPLLTLALRRPVRSLSPYWGRMLDVAEILGALALLPLLAAALGLYGRMLGLGG